MKQKILSIFTIISLLVFQVSPAVALTAPTPPEEPIAPTPPPSLTLENTIAEPTPPQEPILENPTPILSPTTSPTPENNHESRSPSPTVSPTATPEEGSATDNNQLPPTALSTDTTNTSNQNNSTINNDQGNIDDNRNVGDTAVNTGDASTNASITNSINSNISGQPGTSSPDVSITNEDNGADSDNNGSITTNTSNSITQNNDAEIDSKLEAESNSGENSTSYNLGNSSINTGNANTSGTIINFANTNAVGVSVSEFNVVDDQKGDLILDFAGNCISGCNNFGSTSIQNIGNGADSVNTGTVDQTSINNTDQKNTATVGSDMVLSANTGYNTASYNTNGDSVITTGDANVSGNVLNFLNNNIAGQVILGVVNIFGDLIGDIILPEESITSNTNISNTGNGANSTNTSTVNQNTNNTTNQTNTAAIDNNLNLSATTGKNTTSHNTNGDSSTTTGDASVTTQTVNVTNTNIDGGNIWLVLVNEAGKWVGKILGAPEGTNFSGSDGVAVSQDSSGNLTLSNEDNGSGSQNTASVDQTTNTEVSQNNDAKIVNNLDLSANTGKNKASYNTNGDSVINTGDAKVIANIINFVNNNISSGGKVVITVVNVFGNWLGDFVTPGTKKEAANNKGSTEGNQNPTQSSSSNNSTNSSNNTSQDTASGNIAENINDSSDQKNLSKNTTTTGNSLTNTSHPPLIASIVKEGSNKLGSTISKSNNQSPNVVEEKERNEGRHLPVEVLSAQTTSDERVIDINLAWLLIIVPSLVVTGAGINKLRKASNR